MLNLSWLDWSVVVVYFLATQVVGFCAYKKVKDQASFFMGGRRFGKFLMVMFAFGSGTHAETAVGISSQSNQTGLSGIWYSWMLIFITPFYWLLAPIFRRARCVTTAEFFEQRYGTSFSILYACNAAFMCVAFMAQMFFGSGRLIQALTGQALSMRSIILFLMVLVMSYSLVGGLVAVVWSDSFQGLLTILMSLLLIPFMWHSVGGASGLRHRLPDAQSALSLEAAGTVGAFWIGMTALNLLIGFVTQPHIMSNAGAGKTEIEGQVGLVGGVLIKRLCAVPWALVGVMAIALFARRNIKPDLVFGEAIRTYLGPGWIGLMLTAVLASGQATGGVMMITGSGLIMRNILRMSSHPIADRRGVLYARLFSLLMMVAAALIALRFNDMPEAMRFVWKVLPLTGLAFFLGIFWRRANRYGAWASVLCATGALLMGQYEFGWRGDTYLPRLIAFYLACGLGAGIAVSLVTPRENEKFLNDFFLRLNTPIGQEKQLEAAGVNIILK